MPGDRRYELALEAAIAVLRELDGRPGEISPVRLSIATYAILEAMRRGERRHRRRRRRSQLPGGG